MTFEILFVLLGLLGMVVALVLDKMRPGMVLFSVVVDVLVHHNGYGIALFDVIVECRLKRCWKGSAIRG